MEQRTTRHRRDGRGDAAEHRDHRERAGQGAVLVQVADDGPAQHQAGGAAETLDDPQRDQGRGGGRERAEKGRHCPQAHAREQRPPAAEAVAGRAEHSLAGGQADQAARHTELGDAVAGVQRDGDPRQGRKIQVQ